VSDEDAATTDDETEASTGDGGDATSTGDGADSQGTLVTLRERFREVDAVRWSEAIVTGALAYLVGYLVVAAFYYLGPATLGSQLTIRQELGKVGVTFTAAHGVDAAANKGLIVISRGDVTVLGERFDLFQLSEALGAAQPIGDSVYMAVPILVLLAVGFGRAWGRSRSADGWAPVVTTLGLPLGYGALAYLGSLVYSYPIGEYPEVTGIALVARTRAFRGIVQQGNETTIFVANRTQPLRIQGQYLEEPARVALSADPGGAILMGLLYPALFAMFGALLAVSLRQRLGGSEESDG
jgi:hypothetical protein